MSMTKTEKPTAKKKRDAAQKGQTFKSRDMVTTCLTLLGLLFITGFISLAPVKALIFASIDNRFGNNYRDFFIQCMLFALFLILPVLGTCFVASALPGLMQTGARLALKALKIDLAAISPLKGMKKIFNIRTVKELVKTLLYLTTFFLSGAIFWNQYRQQLMSMLYLAPEKQFSVWGDMLQSLLMIFLMAVFVIVILDMVLEYLLYIRELKMDIREVRQEYKETQGNPEIIKARRERHREILDEGTKQEIKKSSVIIANPVHIAIGIYLNPSITPIPFISVMETNARAQAVRRYAKSVGVPVVENITLARSIYRTHKKYTFVSLEQLDNVMQILCWLTEVENAWQTEFEQEEIVSAEPETKVAERKTDNTDRQSDERSV